MIPDWIQLVVCLILMEGISTGRGPIPLVLVYRFYKKGRSRE